MGEIFRDSFDIFGKDYDITTHFVQTPITDQLLDNDPIDFSVEFWVDEAALYVGMLDWLDGTDASEELELFTNDHWFCQFLTELQIQSALEAADGTAETESKQKQTQSPDDILFAPIELERDKKPNPPPVYDEYYD